MAKILIIEDEKGIRLTLSEFLTDTGYDVNAVEDGDKAKKMIDRKAYDVIVTDIILPGLSGIELLDYIRINQPDTQVIIMTGEPTIDNAAESVRLGAFDYLPKPVMGDDIVRVVSRALEVKKLIDDKKRLEKENERYRRHLEQLVEKRTAALQKSEQTFRLMFENNPMAMIICEQDSLDILAVNNAAVRLYKYSAPDFRECNLADIWPEAPAVFEKLLKNNHETIINLTDVRCRKKNGQRFDAEIIANAMVFNGSDARHIMVNDVTDRKRAEAQLRDSEQKFRTLHETMTQGVLYQDRSGKILSANPAAEKLLSMPLVNTKMNSNISERFRISGENRRIIDIEQLPHNRALRSKVPVKDEIIRIRDMAQDNRELWLKISSVPLYSRGKNNPDRVFSTFTDITELKETETRLRKSEQKNRAILLAIPDLIVLLSGEGLIQDIKKSTDTSLPARQLKGKSLSTIYPSAVVRQFQSAIDRARRSGAGQNFEFQLMGNDEVQSFETRLVQISKDEYLSLTRNITERRRYEIDLQKSEKKFRILLESAAQAIVLVDMHGQITLVNKKMEELFGYERAELIGRQIEMLIPKRFTESHYRFRNNFMREPVSRPMGKGVEINGLHKSGREFPLEISLSHVELMEGFFVMALITDVSERKDLEQKIRQVEKLEAIGQLAGGIAHDFNNVLSGIIGLSELAQRKIDKSYPVYETLSIIIGKSKSAADLVRKLLAFSRQQVLAQRKSNLNEIIKNNKKLLQRYLGEDIRLITKLEADLPWISVDQTAMDQIITNLSINARDAMPDGGELLIRTDVVNRRDLDFAIQIPETTERLVRLTIADSGVGMPDDVKKHIFEPFFTTKDFGEGTGLGLATVYGLVKQHNSIIKFDSAIGEGTTFYIYFPALCAVAEDKAEAKSKEIIKGGNEMVLLVDDEADIRKTSKDALEHYGYKVLTAGNGIEALALLEANKDDVALVITDMVMPQMGGMELRLNGLRIKPTIKFLMMSALKERPGRSLPFLEKPFLSGKLLKKVREILDS